MKILKDINTWFWNDKFWLPSNMTWKDISDTSIVNYAQFSDLRNGFKVAFALLVLRYILEKYVFSPIGQHLGSKPNVARKVEKDTTENKVLEKAFIESRKIDHKQIQGLSKQLDWSEIRVERWILRRIHKATTLKKFTENSWKLTWYICIFCYGLYALWDKPWFWTTNYCWCDYPRHSVTDDIWWYYMLELGYHLSFAISQFKDAKRKDYIEIFVHHVVTITLLTFSWTSNFFRIGSLVAVIHDIAPPLICASVMIKCAGNHRAAVACFFVFTVTWIVSRLVIYPYRIICSAMTEFDLNISMFPACYFYFSLLCVLQVLNIIWTCMIVKLLTHSISSKPYVKDVHSDSDESISNSSDNDSSAPNTSNQLRGLQDLHTKLEK